MDREDPVPEADALEQSEDLTGDVAADHIEYGAGAGAETGAGDLGDLGATPEADVIEQRTPVEERRVKVVSAPPSDVPVADWLEQSVVEPLDDDEIR